MPWTTSMIFYGKTWGLPQLAPTLNEHLDDADGDAYHL